MLTLVDLDEAVAELERLIKAGARFLVLTTGPVDGRAPGDPYFDPFWSRVEEAGLNIVFHIGNTPFGEIYSKPWGLRPAPPLASARVAARRRGGAAAPWRAARGRSPSPGLRCGSAKHENASLHAQRADASARRSAPGPKTGSRDRADAARAAAG